MVARAKFLVLKALHHGFSTVGLLTFVLVSLASLVGTNARPSFLVVRFDWDNFRLLLGLVLHDPILEASAEDSVLIFRTRMVNGWITVLPQPVLNFVPLR